MAKRGKRSKRLTTAHLDAQHIIIISDLAKSNREKSELKNFQNKSNALLVVWQKIAEPI